MFYFLVHFGEEEMLNPSQHSNQHKRINGYLQMQLKPIITGHCFLNLHFALNPQAL